MSEREEITLVCEEGEVAIPKDAAKRLKKVLKTMKGTSKMKEDKLYSETIPAKVAEIVRGLLSDDAEELRAAMSKHRDSDDWEKPFNTSFVLALQSVRGKTLINMRLKRSSSHKLDAVPVEIGGDQDDMFAEKE